MSKRQTVIACIERPEDAQRLIAYAQHCAARLNHKEVVLLNVSKKQSADWLKEYGLPYVGLRGEWEPAISKLPETLNTILVVAACRPTAERSSITHPTKLLRIFRKCKTAYLVVNTESDTPLDGWPRTTAFAIDHRRESKEKIIWASYMARFFDSRLVITTPQYKDSALLLRQKNNMRYVDKILTPLGIKEPEVVPIPSKTESRGLSTKILFGRNPDVVSTEKISTELLICHTTDPRETDPIDWLFGTAEHYLLRQPTTPPLLFLNPRDDLYILCD